MAKAAFELRYAWTWDRFTNMELCSPWIRNGGAGGCYGKGTKGFLRDYQLLTDFCQELGLNGILICGLFRKSHGWFRAARQMIEYARSRQVGIIPMVGLGFYGGVVYEGPHRYNSWTWIEKHPELRALRKTGESFADHLCPAHPKNQQWFRDSVRWLVDNFDVAGVNLENGDLVVSYTPLAVETRRQMGGSEPEPYKDQYLSYKDALDELKPQMKRKWIIYATYTGFSPDPGPAYWNIENPSMGYCSPFMGEHRPAFCRKMPAEAWCQWSIYNMIHYWPQGKSLWKDERVWVKPLPGNVFLEDGEPDVVYDNSIWPAELKPPTPRNVAFLHNTRYLVAVTRIKEACLRAYRAGIQGMGMDFNSPPRCVPALLNYLAFSHFTQRPLDSIRDFGRITLKKHLGLKTDRAVRFAEIMHAWETNALTDKDRSDVRHLASLGKKADWYGCRKGKSGQAEQWLVQPGKGVPMIVLGEEPEPAGSMIYWSWLYDRVAGSDLSHGAEFF